MSENRFNQNRRKFGKTALTGFAGGGLLIQSGCSQKEYEQEVQKDTSDINLSVSANVKTSEEQLLFLKQLGLKHVELWVGGDDDKYDNLVEIKKRVENAGLAIAGMYNGNYYHGETGDIHRLGFPGKDRKIEEFKTLMRNMNRIGIPVYHMMGWHSTRVYHGNSYGQTGSTRHCKTLCFDYDVWEEESKKKPSDSVNIYGREFSEEEMWDNFAYFIRGVIPAAEENGIKIGMHPNFPVPQCGGVAYIFNSFESYRKAFEIADSPNFGVLLCIGTWACGGENGLFGDVIDSIRFFGKQGKIFHVHFRNLESPDPPWLETFMDNGYLDMYQVMKALKETGYKGTIYHDHSPNFEGSSAGNGVGEAYAVAYMRGLLQALKS